MTWKQDGDEWQADFEKRFGLIVAAKYPARHILTVWERSPGKWRLVYRRRYGATDEGLQAAKSFAEKLLTNAAS